MRAGLFDDLEAHAPVGEERWEDGELAIVASAAPGAPVSYLLTQVDRQTEKMAVTVEGVRFWKSSGREVKGPRHIIPAFDPVFPILRAQLAGAEHRRAIAAAFWSFQDAPDKARAQYLAAVVNDFLASNPD